MKACKECGRHKPPLTRGMCGACYLRWRLKNPHLVRKARPTVELFWQKVDRSAGPDGCWEWTAVLDHAGYGKSTRIPQVGHTQKAHRISYTLLVGAIPEGLDLDHLCMNPRCVNPSHLEPVTNAENHRRRAAAKTGCVNGHEYNETNTYYHPPTGYRSCRICKREQKRERLQRRSEAA